MSNSIKGIGCDIINISRFDRLIEDPRFLDKVYTANELHYIRNHGVQSAAGLWAAKEVVGKAMGTEFSGFVMKDVEVLHNEQRRPETLLHGRAETEAERLHMERIHISISHEKEQAIAFAVIE